MMKRSRRLTRLLGVFLVFAVVVGGAASCSRKIPVTVTVPISLGSGFEFGDFGGAPGGTEIPGIATLFVSLCSLPTPEDIDATIRDSLGDVLGDLIEVQSLELQSLTLEATEGDFTSLRTLTLLWLPKPVNDVDQDPVELGAADSDTGFGVDLELDGPADAVDLLVLLENDANNPAAGCPELIVEVGGYVPAEPITFDVTASVRVTVLI